MLPTKWEWFWGICCKQPEKSWPEHRECSFNLSISQFSSVPSLSHLWFFVTRWTAARQTSLSITNSRSLPKLTSIESVMPSNHLILCRPLLLSPSIFPSIRVLSKEPALRIRWPKYWFQLQHQLPMNPQDWSPLGWTGWITLQFKGLSSLLLHHSSKASILRCSAFFIVQLSPPYVTTGKTIALTRWTFVYLLYLLSIVTKGYKFYRGNSFLIPLIH